MESNHIATKQDIEHAKDAIIAFVKQSLSEAGIKSERPQTKKYLRSRDIKKMFGVSDNKLKDMRLSGEIPFIKNGKTFFYPEDGVIRYMDNRLNPTVK